jgi:hypothetical protein
MIVETFFFVVIPQAITLKSCQDLYMELQGCAANRAYGTAGSRCGQRQSIGGKAFEDQLVAGFAVAFGGALVISGLIEVIRRTIGWRRMRT